MATPSLNAEDDAVLDDPEHRLPVSESEAREILEEIREEKGYLDDDNISDLAEVKARTKGKVDKIMINYRKEQAKSTRKYNKLTPEIRYMLTYDRTAEDLYSTKFRLIYELLQNADDASHTSGERPCVIFNAYSDKLVVETNEDGFTIANVRAICRTGESSKSASRQGKPIGEKGYGFKSVFAIAYHVRIQSGFWSFYFEHHEGEDGMGMITPFEIAPETLPDGITTRITLTLRSEPDDISAQLIEELKALPDTVTLFLQKIVQLDFRVHCPDRSTVSTSISAEIEETHSDSEQLFVTEKTTMSTQGKGSVMKDRKRYMVFQKSLPAMPLEKRRSGIEESKVKIAFPLCLERFQPLIDERGQYISAFLPMCRVAQLPFLIQADFVTLASRESVVDSKWNRKLLDGIAQTFSTAIESFYNDEELRYLWMRYMPGLHLDGFWQPLRRKIQDGLEDINILESWLYRTPAHITQLKIVPEKYTHRGEPLFDDSDDEIYLSPNYKARDLSTLRDLGVKTMAPEDFLRRLEHDVSLPMRRKAPEDPWHASLYIVLLEILNDPKRVLLHEKIAGLQLIPLRKELEVGESLEEVGENDEPIWVSAAEIRDSPIYFPHSKVVLLPGDFLGGLESFPIPNGIYSAFKIVWPPAVVDPQRKAFFSKMGVVDIDPLCVVDGIHDFHVTCVEEELPPSLTTIIPHLRYLFRFYPSEDSLSEWGGFYWITDGLASLLMDLPDHDYTPLYFKSGGEHSTWGLLKRTSKDIRDQCAKFMHDDILTAETEQAICRGLSWHRWVEKSGPITTEPPLRNLKTKNLLSSILLYVLEHQTEKFLAVLKAHWDSTYRQDVTETASIRTTIAEARVLCRNGQLYTLRQTYLPLKTIQEEARRIGLAQELPLLDLSLTLDASNMRDWEFLLEFGVRSQINLSFYIQALDVLSTFEVDDKRVFPAVSMIYGSIGNMCSREMQKELETSFLLHHRIYTPDEDKEWQAPEDCLWEAPIWLSTKTSLAQTYRDDPGIRLLFQTHLGIRDADYRDCLEQLMWLRDSSLRPSDMVAICLQIYSELFKGRSITADRDWNKIRATFEKERLVLANDKWHAPSTCLWSSGIAISEKVTIAGLYGDSEVISSYGDYGDFKPFFVGRLGVQTADTAMIIDELIGRTKGRNPLTSDVAKCIIREIARMMGTEKIDMKLEASFKRMRQAKALPVRMGQNDSSLEDASAEFVIADHERYDEAFRPKAAFLDFTIDEVQLLHPLIKELGLRNRYLSQKVKEASVIDGDPNSNDALTKELQARAYAFYCCAIKYKSSKVLGHDQSLYEKLGHAQVFQTDGMRTSMILVQHKKKIEVASKRIQLRLEDLTNMHRLESNSDTANEESERTIDTDPYDSEGDNEVDGAIRPDDGDGAFSALQKSARQNPGNGNGTGLQGIKIFVPADTHERRTCYRTQLPGAILTILGIKDTEALLPINRLLNMQHETSSEASLMEEHDIPLVSWVTPPDTLFVRRAASPETGPLESASDVWAVSESNSASSTLLESDPEYERTNEARAVGTARSGLAEDHVKRYRQLLGHIIEQVTRTYTAANTGMTITWNVNNWLDALPESVDVPRLFGRDDVFGVRSEDQLAHDMKIGAAGELFVFETLLRVDPEGFGRGNWESSIRHLVKVHPKYKDMTRNTLIEEADITYVDTEGKLLNWLLQQNPIGMLDWLNEPTETPRKYFIEVKTTTKGRDEGFHMSRPQYERMYSMRKRPHQMPQNVYVIFRVYNLLSDKISMSIYVSPWRAEDAADKILRFDSKGYAVRPVR